MDERFQNLVRRRNYNLAVVSLAVLASILLVSNRMIYTLLSFPANGFERYLSYSLIGIVFAEFAILAIWLTLAHQNWLTRFSIVAVSAIALISAWMLGFVNTFDTDTGMNWANREVLYYMGFIPILFFAVSVPLATFRAVTGYVLAPIDLEAVPVRLPFSIANMLGITAAVAGSLAMAQLPLLIGERAFDLWSTCGIFSAIFFGTGLLALLPATLLLFSRRRSFMGWSLVVLAMSAVLAFGIFYFVAVFTGMRWSVTDMLIPTQATVSGVIAFLLAAATIRLFGYRLAKSSR